MVFEEESKGMQRLIQRVKDAVSRVEHGQIEFTVKIQDGHPVLLLETEMVSGIRIMNRKRLEGRT